MIRSNWRRWLALCVLLVACLCVLALQFGFFSSGKPTLTLSSIVWSFDNRSMCVSFSVLGRDSSWRGNAQWLTTNDLKPVRCLGVSYYLLSPRQAFSRDSGLLYSLNLDGNGKYEIVRHDVLSGKSSVYCRPAGSPRYMVETPGGGNLLVVCGFCQDGTVSEIMEYASGGHSRKLFSAHAAVNPVLTSVSHMDAFTTETTAFSVRSSMYEEYRLSVSCDGDSITTRGLSRLSLPDDIEIQSNDKNLSILFEWLPKRREFEYSIAWRADRSIGPLKSGEWALDGDEVLWLDPKDGDLWHSTSTGSPEKILRRPPKGFRGIAGWNSGIGMACMDGRDSVYVVDIRARRIAIERNKEEFRLKIMR